MKRFIKVSVRDFSTPRASWYYIDNARDFNIKCTIVDKRLGFFKDCYILKVEGHNENIQKFLEYLKFKKFKIH